MRSNDYITKWLSESDENRRLYFQESLILDVTEAICDLLEKRNLSRKQLADLLGTSKSNITSF